MGKPLRKAQRVRIDHSLPRGAKPRSWCFQAAPDLRPVLAQIGQPSRRPFRPDPFQREALAHVQASDLLVCAPTGAGKTWIAVEAMDRRLRAGERSWYASPLKALSNAKYEEFQTRFGHEAVGILTGDRKENPDAPILVGTTEILRNHLYDAMERGQDLRVDLVVVDEAHYLSDWERGVVWEEVLIYLPPRVRILMLSATVGNPREICRWLETIRETPCQLVEERERPVPLYPLFLYPDGRVGLLVNRAGLARPVRQQLERFNHARGRRFPMLAPHEVVEGLRHLGLVPAIFFLKSRADCDRAVESFGGSPLKPGQQEMLRALLGPIFEEHPLLQGHRQVQALQRYGVAAHHAGQLPQWKLLVERLMNMGYLDAIFSTSTVAAGVDFPARTVVLLQSDRYNGRGFAELTATELQQMTGRAGRRGKDLVGFALFVPGPHQDIRRIAGLLRASPEGIRSQIQINFSMVLNLLLSHRPEGIRPLLQRSLAAFQQGWALQGGGGSEGPSTPQGTSAEKVRRDRPAGRMRGSGRRRGPAPAAAEIRHRLRPGRLFLHRDGSAHVIFHMAERRGKPMCMAHRLDRKMKVRKGRVILKGVPLSQIEALLEKRVSLPEPEDVESVLRCLDGLSRDRPNLEMAAPLAQHEGGRPPTHGPQVDGHHTGPWIWEGFLRRLEFLQDAGFVDDQERLTPDGRWASRLRLDHPILVAEAIRRGVFEGRPAPVFAGLIAPFVVDRERETLVLAHDLEEMEDAFDALVARTYEPRRWMQRRGFETPLLQFWPCAALYLWAKGCSWSELRASVTLDDGDLVSLISRTADHLRQVCELADTHPQMAATARKALRRIQREPASDHWPS